MKYVKITHQGQLDFVFERLNLPKIEFESDCIVCIEHPNNHHIGLIVRNQNLINDVRLVTIDFYEYLDLITDELKQKSKEFIEQLDAIIDKQTNKNMQTRFEYADTVTKIFISIFVILFSTYFIFYYT